MTAEEIQRLVEETGYLTDYYNNVIKPNGQHVQNIRNPQGLPKEFLDEFGIPQKTENILPQQETPQSQVNPTSLSQENFATMQMPEQPPQTAEQPSVTEQVSQDTYNALKNNNLLDQINSGNYGWIQQIMANKNSYENADQTAAMLNSQGYNVTGDRIREKTHDNAEYIRKLANAEGIDLGAWGSAEGVSNADSQFAMDRYNYEQAKAAQEKFENVQKQLREDYAQSSQKRFEELYDYYRSQHKSQRDSIILAGRETMKYAKERTGFLQNAMEEYGIDDGAIMNQFGVSILGQLATEDNIMGTAYAQAYQTPKENYNKMLEMQKQRETNQAAYDRMIQQAANQMRLAEFNQSQNNWRTGQQIESSEKIAANHDATSRQNTLDRITSDNNKFELGEKHKFELEDLKFEHDKFLRNMENDRKNNKTAEKLTDNPYYKFAKENVDQTYKDYSLLLGKSDDVDEKLIEEARQKYEDAKNQLRDIQKTLLLPTADVEVAPAKDMSPQEIIAYGKKLASQGMIEQAVRDWLSEAGITGADQRRYVERIFGK